MLSRLAFILAAVSILLLPLAGWIKAGMLGLLVLRDVRLLRRLEWNGPFFKAYWEQHACWELDYGKGQVCLAELEAYWMCPFFVLVHLKTLQGHHRYHSLFRDSLSSETYRQLRVWLKCHTQKRSDTEN